MDKLKISNASKNTDTITRTIRISGYAFDTIMDLAEQYGISFNNVINQIIEYGLKNIDNDENNKPEHS